MDAERYVVVSMTSEGIADPGFDPLAAGAGDISVADVSIPAAEAADAARRPGTVVAPVMPLQLIRPVPDDPEVDEAGARGRSGTAWGVEAVGATSSPFTGRGVIVAVLDTGIDATHVAFAPGRAIERDFVDGGPGDADGHGTHCAGTIAGRDVDGLRIGIAPDARIVACKVLGGNERGTAALFDAIWWAATSGVHILSMSLGIDFSGYVESLVQRDRPRQAATSQALTAYRDSLTVMGHLAALIRARNATGESALLVAASGNDSRRGTGSQGYTIGASWPASVDGYVAVGAVGKTGGPLAVAPFSNTGVRVAGPGVAVTSARAGGGLVAMQGTSMATPHVAGVAALWAQRSIEESGRFDAGAVEAMVVANCAKIPGASWQDVGQGLVRAPQP